MNKLLSFSLILIGLSGLISCETQQQATKLRFSYPEAGTIVRSGNPLLLKLHIPDNGSKVDSVIYSIDGAVISSVLNGDSITVDTDGFAFGSRSLSAKVYQGGQENTAYSNIVFLPKAPQHYGFKVINEFPHDPEAFTQGLEYHNGVLYESTGQYDGQSSLRRVDLSSGQVQKKINLSSQYFGEGITIVGNRIIQLTWRENVALVYDLQTFAKIGEFSYGNNKEGWGLCYDGNHLILSDGTNRLYFLNKDTFREEYSVTVHSHQGPVGSLNELEYINGKVYANVYQKDIIVIINPQSGAVEGEINLIGLYPEKDKILYDNELNGIAYDRQNDRLFVTGKNWSKLFEIETVAR